MKPVHRCGLLPDQAARLFGVDEAVGRKLLAAAVGRGERDLKGIEGVRKEVLRAIESASTAEPLRIAAREPAADGFLKLLFELDDGAQVEAVRIPVPCEVPGADLSAFEGKEKKYIVCVSSQAGCALACSFCATGALGFRRNLEPHEIVGQILAIRAEADRPVRGVVFMGMGEPFLNYDNVIAAARILCHPAGGQIDARARRTRVLVEYVLLGGVNDSVEDARALARLLDPKLVVVDLIDVNGTTGGYVRSDRAQRSAFIDVLAEARMPFAIRYSGGQDVQAGCGQLAAGSPGGARMSPL